MALYGKNTTVILLFYSDKYGLIYEINFVSSLIKSDNKIVFLVTAFLILLPCNFYY